MGILRRMRCSPLSWVFFDAFVKLMSVENVGGVDPFVLDLLAACACSFMHLCG